MLYVIILVVIVLIGLGIGLFYLLKKDPIDGGWSEWTNDGQCSKTCGGGKRKQTRRCDSPVPSGGGQPCEGQAMRLVDCNTQACPVNGGWSEWTNDGACSKTCGGGQQKQTRRCDSPVPSGGGQPCEGETTRFIDCNTHACPVNGGLSDWTNDGACSKTCGGGQQKQTRRCDNPVPSGGGQPCEGETTRFIDCNTQACPANTFSEWSAWSPCTSNCTTQERSRTCLSSACQDATKERRACPSNNNYANCWFQLKNVRSPELCLYSLPEASTSTQLRWDRCDAEREDSYWKLETVNGNGMMKNKKHDKCLTKRPSSTHSTVSTCAPDNRQQHWRLNANNTLQAYNAEGGYNCIVNRNYTRPPVPGDTGTRIDTWICDNNAEQFIRDFPKPL